MSGSREKSQTNPCCFLTFLPFQKGWSVFFYGTFTIISIVFDLRLRVIFSVNFIFIVLFYLFISFSFFFLAERVYIWYMSVFQVLLNYQYLLLLLFFLFKIEKTNYYYFFILLFHLFWSIKWQLFLVFFKNNSK